MVTLNAVGPRQFCLSVVFLSSLGMVSVAKADLTDSLTVSPTAMSLGNAVTADPPGVESIHFNPAGLARMTGNTKTDSIFVASIRTRSSFSSAPDLDLGGFKVDPLNGTTSGPVRQAIYLPIIGLVHKRLPAAVIPGIGFTFNKPDSPFTFGTLSYLSMAYTIDRSEDPNDPARFGGKLVDIQRLVYLSPAVGYKVSETLRVGVSVPIAYASMAMNTDMRFPNKLLGTIGKLQEGTCPSGNSTVVDTLLFGLCGGGKDGMLNPFKKAANFNLDMTAPFEPTINLGVLWEPKEWFSFGAAFQGGSNTVYHGSYQFTTEPMLRQFVQGMNSSLLGPIVAATIGFPVRIPEVQSGNVIASIAHPSRIQMGIKLKPVDFLQFTMDMSYADWSKWKTLTFKFDQNIGLLEMGRLFGVANPSQLVLPLGAKNVISYGFGMQAQLTKKMALRLGYEPRRSSIPSDKLSLFAPLPDTKLKSIGFQYKFDSGGVLNVAGSYLKGTYDVPARTDCNLNCDGFFNLIYNPYAAMNVSGNIIVRYGGMSYTHPF
ncbi:outer membrane protein transport protein [soil metagenome]